MQLFFLESIQKTECLGMCSVGFLFNWAIKILGRLDYGGAFWFCPTPTLPTSLEIPFITESEGTALIVKKLFLFNGTTSSPLAIWTSNNIKGGTDLLYKDQCPVSLGKETLQNTQNLSLTRLVRDIDESDLSHVGLFHEITNPSLLQLADLVH